MMIQNRRDFLGSAMALAQPARKWDLLIFANDQHRADCVGCYGDPVVKTPVVDKLAAEGVELLCAD